MAGVIGANVIWPKKNIIVIDAGTCLTIDFINSDKEYVGGRISPGIEMRYNALHTFTHKLPLIKSEKNKLVIGNDTKTSIISGVQQIQLILEITFPLDLRSVEKGEACF